MLANGTMPYEGRSLIYDYVPWEQMTKQRRGLMWAMQLAHGIDRTLVLPPLRFHTAHTKSREVYDYVPYSTLFDLQPLAEIHPIVELHELLAASAGRVDLVFSLLKGLPPGTLGAQQGMRAPPNRYWVDGECATPVEAECEVDEQGEEVCMTPLNPFAGASGGAHVRNLTCGWAPDMRWDRILRGRDVRSETSIAIQGIVYQIPPPMSVAPLVAFREALSTGGKTCGWQCPYNLIRNAMVYRREFVDAARAFLASARQRHTALGVAQQRGELSTGAVLDYASGDGPELGSGSSGGGGSSGSAAAAERVRVLAVHWRRGDFLSRAGLDHVCQDETTGVQLLDGKTGAPCVKASVVLTPQQLAIEVRESLALNNASLVFLASNAKQDDVAALETELRGTPLLRYEPPASPSGQSVHSDAQLAVIDTLVCALADAFLGTRRSMFSWNILEERVLQDRSPMTGRLMGLPRGTRRASQ